MSNNAQSGFTTNLPLDVLLNTGVLFVGNTPIGASQGGLVFDPGIKRENIKYDGKVSDRVGLDRIVSYEPKITGTMLQIAKSKRILQVEPGATYAPSATDATITPKPGSTLYTSGEYLTNLRLIFQRQNNAGLVQVKFPVALCEKYDFKGRDGLEVLMAVEFKAKLPAASAEGTCPYIIEFLATLS